MVSSVKEEMSAGYVCLMLACLLVRATQSWQKRLLMTVKEELEVQVSCYGEQPKLSGMESRWHAAHTQCKHEMCKRPTAHPHFHLETVVSGRPAVWVSDRGSGSGQVRDETRRGGAGLHSVNKAWSSSSACPWRSLTSKHQSKTGADIICHQGFPAGEL